MKVSNVEHCPITKSLLIRHFALKNDINSALSIIDNSPVDKLTSHMISNSINICNNSEIAWKLLQLAISVNMDDAAVYTSAVQVCTHAGDYTSSYRIIDMMIDNKILMNKIALSILISTCIQGIIDDRRTKSDVVDVAFSPISALKLFDYMVYIQTNYPILITPAVCQRIIKELNDINEPILACKMYMGPLIESTCSVEVLSHLFTNLQTLCTSLSISNNTSLVKEVALNGLAIIGAHNSSNRLKYLRISHFNCLLRMLRHANFLPKCKEIFNIMTQAEASNTQSINSRQFNNSKLYIYPNTFTIAELIRVARELKDSLFAVEVIKWGISEKVFIPIGVFNDAISLAYWFVYLLLLFYSFSLFIFMCIVLAREPTS